MKEIMRQEFFELNFVIKIGILTKKILSSTSNTSFSIMTTKNVIKIHYLYHILQMNKLVMLGTIKIWLKKMYTVLGYIYIKEG